MTNSKLKLQPKCATKIQQNGLFCAKIKLAEKENLQDSWYAASFCPSKYGKRTKLETNWLINNDNDNRQRMQKRQKQNNNDNRLAIRLTGLYARHCTIYNLRPLDQICQTQLFYCNNNKNTQNCTVRLCFLSPTDNCEVLTWRYMGNK